MTETTAIENKSDGDLDLMTQNPSLMHHQNVHYDDDGVTVRHFPMEVVPDPTNIHAMAGIYDEKEVIGVGDNVNPAGSDIINNVTTCNDHTVVDSLSVSEQNVGNNGANMSLEDYKCPICLDTFINTVKVDCCYGHKFCNFCIQCWINFERHLVTECPVCRGPIFGKRLDLKTDAEIRAIYDSFSEEEKKARLLSIKERLQLEYPNSNIQLISNDFDIPMRISDTSHHNFNHDLNIPIPLIGFVSGEPMQFTSSPQENVGESHEQAFWPQEMMYSALWDNPFVQDYQYMNVMPIPQMHQVQQHVELDQSNVQHQHYRHQNQENSLWDNNLYVTADDTRTLNNLGVSPPGSIPGLEPQYFNQMTNRQNQFPDDSPGGQYQTGFVIQQPSHNTSEEHTIIGINSNSTAPAIPRNVSPQNQFPITVFPSPPTAIQSPPQATAPINPVNGFYCCYCYIPSCPNNNFPTRSPHCAPPSSLLQFPVQGAHSHQGISNNGCPTSSRQSHCHYTSTATPLHGNLWNNSSGNIPAASYFPPRIRPNMPGASSTSVQLPSPNNIALAQAHVSHMIPEVNSRRATQSPSSCYQSNSASGISNTNSERATAAHQNSQWRTRQSPSNFHDRNSPSGQSRTPISSSTRISTNGQSHQPQTRQSVQVSSCPLTRSNNRAHFSGGFSLFSVGHINFQICHTPKTMMVAGRQVTMPTGRLTHPLVSLIPMNQDGSSTRVSLTFEVHRF